MRTYAFHAPLLQNRIPVLLEDRLTVCRERDGVGTEIRVIWRGESFRSAAGRALL